MFFLPGGNVKMAEQITDFFVGFAVGFNTLASIVIVFCLPKMLKHLRRIADNSVRVCEIDADTVVKLDSSTLTVETQK
jgi:hypothetical protein